MRFSACCENFPKPIKALIILLLLAVVGLLNILTGWELDFPLFYILPIAFATWFLGCRTGFLACIVCTAVWFWVDMSLDELMYTVKNSSKNDVRYEKYRA